MGDEAVRQGIIGAEKLAETINQWLAGIFQTIGTCGGDVYVVAGDAILAVWFTDAGSGAADAVAAAVQAGLSVQAKRQDSERQRLPRSIVSVLRADQILRAGRAGRTNGTGSSQETC